MKQAQFSMPKSREAHTPHFEWFVIESIYKANHSNMDEKSQFFIYGK
jgi:hypothetical protein